MNAATAQAKAVRMPHAGMAKEHGRKLRLIGRLLLVAMALVLAWLLVSAEAAREQDAGCHHRSYRDPVTGQQVARHC